MSNIVKLEFSPLLVTGINFVAWSVDVKNHLRSKNLIETLNEVNSSTESEKASSLVFIRRHIDESLKNEHLTVEDPSELWKSLKDRYDHQKDVLLPKYRDMWTNLRFQDYKKVSEYNSAMFKIIAYLSYCGVKISDEQKIEKTLSTFHQANIILQQQYRLRGFKEYSQLITNLLVAEEYNDLLIKNHESRPTGSKTFPETNLVNHDKSEHTGNNQSRGNGRGRGRGRGRSRGQGRGRGGYNHNQNPHKPNNSDHKRNRSEWNQGKPNIIEKGSRSSNGQNSRCNRCGLKGHWARTCRSSEHFARLYAESQARKGKEVNFADYSETDFTHLQATDFHNDFGNMSGNFSEAKEVDYIDRDSTLEYTHLGESDLYEELMKNGGD